MSLEKIEEVWRATCQVCDCYEHAHRGADSTTALFPRWLVLGELRRHGGVTLGVGIDVCEECSKLPLREIADRVERSILGCGGERDEG